MTQSSRFPKSILNLVRVASLALLAATLVVAAKPQAARAEEWVQATSHEDPEGLWTGEGSAYDGSTSSYTSDTSNRTGYGAVLRLQYSTAVSSDRVRVYADFGFGIVDKVRLKVTYADDSTETNE